MNATEAASQNSGSSSLSGLNSVLFKKLQAENERRKAELDATQKVLDEESKMQ